MTYRRASEDDAAFRQKVEGARGRYNLSDIIARRTTLKRAGREMRGLCLWHREKTPSLYVNDQLGVYLCRGCGAKGDVISAVMHIERCSFGDALRWLSASDLPLVDPALRVQAIARDDAERDAKVDAAAQIWNAALPVDGTPGEVYLRSRRITAWPSTIRFARTWSWCDWETDEVGPDLPALICLVTDGDDDFYGIQRIFLKEDGRRKAALTRPKLSLGRVRGGALRLGPPAPELIVCEGPEDGLSLAQGLHGQSVWVVLGTAMMPEVQYPPEVTSIVIAGQNDAPGRAAVEKAEAGLLDRGLIVRPVWPDADYKDWNDQLRRIRC